MDQDMKMLFNKQYLTRIFSIILLLGLVASISVFTGTKKTSAAWYSDTAWQYRQKVVIDHNQVANSDQTDFPALIKITDPYNTIFTQAKDDGTDIMFTASDATTKLSHEIDTFSKTSKELDAWVKIPTLSHTTDTVLYMYYGNASATDQQNKADVWSNGYVSAWHMSESSWNGTSGEAKDALGVNNATAAASLTTAVGKIGRAENLTTDGQYLNVATPTNMTLTDASWEVWIKPADLAADRLVFGRWPVGSNAGQIAMTVTTTGTLVVDIPYVKTNIMVASAGTIKAGVWQKIVVQRTAAGAWTLYKDNASIASATDTTTWTNNGAFRLGARPHTTTSSFIGEIDEARVSSTTRSADWIATQYNNQTGPETFSAQYSEVNVNNYQTITDKVWYSSDWRYSQKITIDKSKVSGTQTDFPMLVSLTDDASPNSVFEKAQPDGDDIVFTAANGTKLSHEIESFVTTAGSRKLIAWVKIPLLSSSFNTDIYLNYGNAAATDQQDKTGVWSSSVISNVWHLNEDPTGTAPQMTDSKGSLNGTAYGLAAEDSVAAKIKNGLNFATSDRVVTGRPSTVVDNWMIEAWVKPNALNGGEQGIYYNGDDSAGYGLMLVGANIKILEGGVAWIDSGYAFANTTDWVHVVARRQSGTITFVVNGVQQANTSTSAPRTPANSAEIGHEPGNGGRYLNGNVDELKFYTGVKDNGWITTEYNNQNAPASFYALGSIADYDSGVDSGPTVLSEAKNVSGGSTNLTSGNFYNYSTPYFAWPAAETVGGANDKDTGIAGYYVYFGTSCGASGADPETTRGVLSDAGGGLHFQTGTTVSVPDLGANDETYCLRIKTKDNAGNVTASWEAFAAYKYDLTVPSAISYIAVNPAGYSATNSFAFSWPAVSDSTGSGLAGYQYKRGGSSGDDWSATITSTSVSNIQSYQVGQNIFYVRAVDVAGNFSPESQTNYYYTSNAPSKPTSLTATPTMSDANLFEFNWTAPVHGADIAQYGYSINAVPTEENVTWTSSNTTSLPADAYAVSQGSNILYLVAKDVAGNYSFDQANVASVEFICQTVAPPIPRAVSAVDSSDRTTNNWMITVQWAAGEGQNQDTFDHYAVERSTDGINFTQLATTSSTAYIDAGLNNNNTYYYKITAVDNAGSISADSATVSKVPTGKYPTPPTIVAEPTSSVKATAATVSWIVNRASTGTVKFGKTVDQLDRSQLDPTDSTSHQIVLPGLTPSTTYYFKVQSLDNDREYSESEAFSSVYSFQTLAAPGISNVTVSNLTLNSADISWETSSAATTLVRYGTSINYDKSYEDASSLTTKHTFKLTDLTHTTTYHFRISGLDGDNNTINSDDYVFDTLPQPKVSAVSFDTDYSQAEPQTSISWTTNVATTSSVEYFPKGGGSGVAYEESQSDLISAHKVLLTKLSDNTSYSFYVSGTDQFGNKVNSDEYVFSTPFDTRAARIFDVTVEPSNVGLDKQDKAQLIISWKTDELATTQVEYGEGVSGDYSNKTTQDQTLTNEHFVIISDLQPNMPYHLRAISADKGNNISTSEDISSVPGEVPKSIMSVILQTFDNIFGWMTRFIK